MFFPLSYLIPQSLRKYKIASPAEAYLICKQADLLLKKLIKNITAQSLYLKDKTLWLAASSPAAANEIKNYEQVILDNLQSQFKAYKIKEIKIICRNLDDLDDNHLTTQDRWWEVERM